MIKRKIFKRATICAVFFLVLLSFAYADVLEIPENHVEIIMDTWEIVPAISESLFEKYPRLYCEDSEEEEFSIDNFDVRIPWEKYENIGIWVSGWMFEDRFTYIYETELIDCDLDIVIDDNVFFEDGQFIESKTTYQDRVRVSFYIALRDQGLNEEELEELLLKLQIIAYYAEYYFGDNNNVIETLQETDINMRGIEKKVFEKGFDAYTLVTSLQKADEEVIKKYSDEQYWSVKAAKGEPVSAWNLEITFPNELPRTHYYAHYDNIRVLPGSKWIDWTTADVLSINFLVSYQEKEPTYEEVVQILKDSGLGIVATFEVFLDNDGGPYYYIPFDFSVLDTTE